GFPPGPLALECPSDNRSPHPNPLPWGEGARDKSASVIALALFSLLAASDGGAAFDPQEPSTWALSAKLGKGALRDEVLREWTAPSTDSFEKALTREQAQALLDDPRAQAVYAEKTISIVAPSMQLRQRQQH